MDAKKMSKKDRANLERYAEIIRAEIVRLEEDENRRYRPSDYAEWIDQRRRQLEMIGRALEEGSAPSTPCTAWDALEAFEDLRAAEQAAKAETVGFYTPPELYRAQYEAGNTARAIVHIALEQARALALEALAADPEPWTKKPAHYKATAKAVRRITDAALMTTGCRATLTCDYGDWSYPTLQVSVDHVIWPFARPKSIDARLTNNGGYLSAEDLTARKYANADMTPAQARRIIAGYRADVEKAEKMAAAYADKAAEIKAKYRPFDLGDDLERALKPCI